MKSAASPCKSARNAGEPPLPRPVLPPTLFSRKPDPAAPGYLDTYYWWAYVEPRAIRFFERDWLINLILCGNYQRLGNAALAGFGNELTGRTLQMTCCYGNLTPRLAAQVAAARGSLDVIDVMPAQIDNLARKLTRGAPAHLHRMDSRALDFPDAQFDRVLLFFLLHEQPPRSREKSLCEALRVLKPGGRLVIVDYGRPARWHPLRYLLLPLLGFLEPFAVALWRDELTTILSPQLKGCTWHKTAYFGGLYQVITVEKT